MSICALTRFPLKSARGERLGTVAVEPDGLAGDRIWACVDAGDATVGSLKHPRRWGRLRQVRARLVGDAVLLGVAGRTVRAGTPEADTVLSAFLGRAVRLTRTVPEDARLHRLMPTEPGMIPEWMAGTAPGAETVSPLAPNRRFVDFAAVHLVTTGALSALAGKLGRGGLGGAPFRPNIVVDAARDFTPGAVVQVGDLLLRVSLPTPRCVVPGLAEPAVLPALARHYRIPVPGFSRAACFGVYADVLRPGRIRVGDRVTLPGGVAVGGRPAEGAGWEA